VCRVGGERCRRRGRLRRDAQGVADINTGRRGRGSSRRLRKTHPPFWPRRRTSGAEPAQIPARHRAEMQRNIAGTAATRAQMDEAGFSIFDERVPDDGEHWVFFAAELDDRAVLLRGNFTAYRYGTDPPVSRSLTPAYPLLSLSAGRLRTPGRCLPQASPAGRSRTEALADPRAFVRSLPVTFSLLPVTFSLARRPLAGRVTARLPCRATRARGE
jgi:hypothetical protein